MGDDLSRPKPVTRRRAKPVLLVKFTGDGISPERVPLGTLSRALNAINQLTEGDHPIAATKEGESFDPGLFQLVGVREGSALYAFGGVPKPDTFERLRVVGRALKNPG